MELLRRGTIALCAAIAVGAAGCGSGHDVRVNGAKVEDAQLVKRDSSRALGPGDIRIASTDSAVEVAIVGDSLVAGLGARVRDKVTANLDTMKVSGTGLGANIEKMVKGAVATALDHEIEFPLEQISDVQAEGGHLVFFDKDGKQMNMFKSKNNGSDDTKSFRPEDAQAFVAAFKARKGHGA